MVEALDYGADQMVVSTDTSIFRRFEIGVEAGKPVCFRIYVAIYTSRDGAEDLADSAIAATARALTAGYDRLLFRHAHRWHERWLRSDVRIEGDPHAQRAMRYSIFQLMQAAPMHTDRASIPGRGLAGQMYKGAIFWDTDVFMLPFFIYTQPEAARKLVMYRCHTLNGARAKAAEYGYRGAFYAWESQETGEDACTLFNITDVFTNRPMRTYFRDKQIHISADVAHGIWQYSRSRGTRAFCSTAGPRSFWNARASTARTRTSRRTRTATNCST